MPRKKLPPPDLAINADFVKALEEGIRRILKDPTATPTQIAAAVNAGVKLESFRHEKDLEKDDDHSFFNE